MDLAYALIPLLLAHPGHHHHPAVLWCAEPRPPPPMCLLPEQEVRGGSQADAARRALSRGEARVAAAMVEGAAEKDAEAATVLADALDELGEHERASAVRARLSRAGGARPRPDPAAREARPPPASPGTR